MMSLLAWTSTVETIKTNVHATFHILRAFFVRLILLHIRNSVNGYNEPDYRNIACILPDVRIAITEGAVMNPTVLCEGKPLLPLFLTWQAL